MANLKDYVWKIVKTMAETGAAMMTIGMAVNEIDWVHLLSVMAVSGVYTALINVGDLKGE